MYKEKRLESSILKEAIEKIISYSFSRSSGPGGQNVNKLNTRVTAKVRINGLDCLSDDEKNRVREKLSNRLSEEDTITIHVQDERTQQRNKEIALARMTAIIARSLAGKKKRIPTTPGIKAKEKRLFKKKIRSALKKERKRNESG
jgi:ribosome-associated protein